MSSSNDTEWEEIPVDIYFQPQLEARIDSELLNEDTKECNKFWALKIPLCKDDAVHVRALTNKWSLSHSFVYEDQRSLIPSFLANVGAWMFTWEISNDIWKEPTKAWKGKYCIWLVQAPLGLETKADGTNKSDEEKEEEKEQCAFYMLKQDPANSKVGEPMRFKSLARPGPEVRWWNEEMGRIRGFIATLTPEYGPGQLRGKRKVRRSRTH